MKKWGFFLFIVVLLGYAIFGAKEYLQQKLEDFDGKYENQGMSINNSKTIEIVPQDQLYQGDLILVNKEYPIHQEGVKSDIVNVSDHADLMQGYVLLDPHIRLSTYVVQKFQKMIEAAGKEGVNHFLISSGYRDLEEQDKLYQEKGSDYALPAGYSEHNLGLSLDIGSTQSEMSKAPEGSWLQKNAWKYGFVLRYPKDKTDITGIQFEPWHFRYVGLPHSAIMEENKLVLEQYLDYIRENKSISTVVEGEAYNISYYPLSQNIIKVPENGQYEISGNNIDGVIVTVQK
ncbi:M15 family metallopeptidase [Paenibacillus sp. 19GGS1-52]|uniref:M15 family metallopeptidase n=1 Tax=Paenibacillus sp. 19GGS1-52 TaxID=2758563 RepID=UPI001EFC1AAF|nr:M15 family metallopeptidase [Paenibacillus sp. 19GGS1-52]ULO07688.1 M15 family metallopeptidase [Paenibacillus sp. 19GGS1-52]